MQMARQNEIRDAAKRAFRELLAAACFLILVLMPLAVPAQQAAPGAQDRIQALLDQVREEHALLSRAGFDPDTLVSNLDLDATNIVSFIRENIEYEPYQGVLRGAEGTLMTRAGNSFDTAILLSRLLGDSGYEVRIAQGTLSPERGIELLAQIIPRPPIPEDDDPPIANTAPFAFALERSDWLESKLRDAGIPLGGKRTADGLIEESSDYAWVEYRLSAGNPWIAVHNYLDTDPKVAANRYFSQIVPEDLLHVVTLEVQIERRIGDRTEVETVAGPWSRPAANLHGRLIEIFNFPNTADSDALGSDIGEALDQASLFTPMIAGAPGAKSFDLSGTVVDTSALSMDAFGATALFQTLGDAADDAASALGGLTSASGALDDARALTGAWINYSLTAPDGKTRQWRRALLEPLPEEMDKQAQRIAFIRQLTVHHGLMVSTGKISADFAADRAYARITETEPLWTIFLNYLEDRETTISPRDWPSSSSLAHIGLYRALDRGATAMGGDRVYRHRPGLVVIRQGLSPLDRSFHSVDIVSNPRRVLDLSGETPVLDAAILMKIGVWETVAESYFEPLTNRVSIVTDPFTVFRAAEVAGIIAEWIHDAQALAKLSLDPVSQGNLRRELEQGFIALAPISKPPDQRLSAWWRVNPETGNTLGMLSDGRGQAVTEYLTDVALLTYGLAKAIKGYQDCEAYGSTFDRACCLVETHINNVSGVAMGGMLGKAYGGGVARMCDVASVARDAITAPPKRGGVYDCKFFDPEFDHTSLFGPGGAYDTTTLGCGGFKGSVPKQ